MNRSAIALLVLASSLSACAQFGQDEHAAHHPPGASGPGGMGPRAGMPDRDEHYAELMRRMQDMHQRMQAARTPAERQALMDEHMRLMQSGMEMMGRMGSMGGGMSGPMAGAPGGASRGSMDMPDAQANSGMPGGMGPGQGGMAQGGMGPMTGMHAAMQRRLAMMERMMQMMVDREAATPSR